MNKEIKDMIELSISNLKHIYNQPCNYNSKLMPTGERHEIAIVYLFEKIEALQERLEDIEIKSKSKKVK